MDKMTEALKIMKDLFEMSIGELEETFKKTKSEKIKNIIFQVMDAKISKLKNNLK